MLVNSKELLLKEKANGYAIPALNFVYLNTMKWYLEATEERKLPIIIQLGERFIKDFSLESAVKFSEIYAAELSIPVVLHLDHGTDEEAIMHAIDLGFTSVMIDASKKPLGENIKITKSIVDYAHENNVTVEAELGQVGRQEKTISASNYTKPEEAVVFIKETNVDSLAVTIGTTLGLYRAAPKINFEILETIHSLVETPLVLHGGSSTGDHNIRKCAQSGIAKVNIYSDLVNLSKDIPTNKNYYESTYLMKDKIKKQVSHIYDILGTSIVLQRIFLVKR